MTHKLKEPTLVLEKPISSKARFLGFDIEREDWNEYVIEDGTILRVRWILIGALIDSTTEELEKKAKSSQKLRMGFGIRAQNVFAVESPPKFMGPPDPKTYSVEELRASIVTEELDFETKRETWNSYLFKNGMAMKARISPTSVSRTSKFDISGVPVYLVDSTVNIKLELPETVKRILKKKGKAMM